jgi:hypothetical protein
LEFNVRDIQLMKRPTWVTVIGIFAIIFGGVGFLLDVAMVVILGIFSLGVKGQLEIWLPFFSLATVTGIVSMLIAGIYFLSGIFLMMMEPFAIKFFYITIFLSILWAMIQVNLTSVIINVILLIIVVTSDKTAFSH